MNKILREILGINPANTFYKAKLSNRMENYNRKLLRAILDYED